MLSRHEDTITLFCDLTSREDDAINLPAAALVIARVHYPDLDVRPYLDELAEMAADVAARLGGVAEAERLSELSAVVFGELGFQGNRDDYYDPRNSCLNDVLDRRLGIPITLSLVYMEMASACGWATEGVGFPGHFIVRDVTSDLLIDPFDSGGVLDSEDLQRLLKAQGIEEGRWSEEFLEGVSKRQMLLRMMNNLRRNYTDSGDDTRLGVLEVMSDELTRVSEDGPASIVQ